MKALRIKRLIAVILCITMGLSLAGCGRKQKFVPLADGAGWFCAWACAPEAAGEEDVPPSPGMRGVTCRQVIKASVSGSKIRLTISNEFGNIPLVIEKVHIARLVNLGSPAIDVSTDTVVTFGGKEDLALDVGKTITSDEVSFSFDALDNIAVSIKVGDYTGGVVTCHRNGKNYSWVCDGDKVSEENLTRVKVLSGIYYLKSMDVYGEAGTRTAAVLGDSISDGVGSTANTCSDWVSEADLFLKSNPHCLTTSIVNIGRNGFTLLSQDGGDSLTQRIEKEVLSLSGVRYIIIQGGINDIASAQADISEKLIEEYKKAIELCHSKGIRVYGCTVTPCRGNFVYSELHERIRGALNRFILSEDSGLDGFIDFSSILASEEDPAAISAEYLGVNTDYLHPNDAGYAIMGEEAYHKLSDYWRQDELAAESAQ